MRKIPNINTHIFKQPGLPWISPNLFLSWENIDMDTFSVEAPDGFNADSAGLVGFDERCRVTGTFSMATAQDVQITYDEINSQADTASQDLVLVSEAAGDLDSTTLVGNQTGQVDTLTNTSGAPLTDCYIAAKISGFSNNGTIELRNTVINLL